MANDFRVIGRDITLRATEGGQLLSEITAVKDLTFKLTLKLLSEGFLGESALRHREVFDEVQLTWGIEPEGKQVFGLIADVYQRARTGQANPVQINIGFRIQFPSGTIVRITVPDIQFDDIGNLNVSGRDAFAAMTFSGKSNRYIIDM
jgi:hypothetical protein